MPPSGISPAQVIDNRILSTSSMAPRGFEHPAAPIPHILFGFRPPNVYIARELGADGDRDSANTTLLDLQR